MVVRVLLGGVDLCRVPLAADGAEHKTSQQELVLAAAVDVEIVIGDDLLNTLVFLEAYHRLVPAHAPLTFPDHQARVERILENVDHDAVRNLLACLGTKPLFVEYVAEFVGRIAACQVEAEALAQ